MILRTLILTPAHIIIASPREEFQLLLLDVEIIYFVLFKVISRTQKDSACGNIL
jgi:hypothetical protein